MRRFPLYIGLLLAMYCVFGGVSFARADSLGDNRSFFTDTNYDAVKATTITATARAVSQNAYFYVDDRYWSSLSIQDREAFSSELDQLASDFDAVIYPRSTSLWGNEPKPGVDNDSHVTVLLEKLATGSGGYFSTVNEYPQSRVASSNAREMVYVSVDSVLSGMAPALLAHEFQHLISFNQKELTLNISDDVWLNEARSEYNVTVNGYDEPFNGSTLQRRMATFLKSPSDSLVEWPNIPTDYAIASLFTHYVADRFGSSILASTIHSQDAGVVALNDSLAAASVTESLPDIFTDWMVASYLNDGTLGSQYTYVRPGLKTFHVAPRRIAYLNGTGEVQATSPIKEWQPVWYEYDLSSSARGSLTFQLSGGEFSGAVVATYSDGQRSITRLDQSERVVISVSSGTSWLTSTVVMFADSPLVALGDRAVNAYTTNVTATLGDVPPVYTPPTTPLDQITDGDLIRRNGQSEVYVVWGGYRRYMTPGALRLYGFDTRPVKTVADAAFFGLKSSNYIRSVNGEKVYAVWPDGTKHWLNITPAQWDASSRDWGAIFIVNDAEVAYYPTGADITQ